jgi:MFS family permease
VSAESNLRLYPWYQAAASFLPWMPVFFLYFSDTVSLQEAIELGAIYYLSVVLLEVPSGYCSDRIGRRTTLTMASAFAVAAYIIFIFAASFSGLAIAQALLAGAIAFQSGSDSSLLYDSLSALERETEYTQHEARAQQYSMVALAVSVLLGGALGSIDYRLAYAAALAAAVITLVLCARFTEPDRVDGSETYTFVRQLQSAVVTARHPVLLWILFFYLTGYSLQHIPYEFYQPYIALLQKNTMSNLLPDQPTAMVSGVVIGLSMFGGALGARLSANLSQRAGKRTVLLAGLTIQCLIIGMMAALLHPAMLLMILFRNFSMAMTHAPMHGLIAPQVPSAQRATYLSLQSLAARLTFSLFLFFIAGNSGETLNWPALSSIFQYSVVFGLLALAGLALLSGAIRRADVGN